MLLTVVTASRSSGIGHGLTYESDEDMPLGSLVEVPLRRRVVEGIVIAKTKGPFTGGYDLKKIKRLLSPTPLLSEHQIKTAAWMAEYYVCTFRQALQVFLPSPPWTNLLPKETTVYSLIHNSKSPLPAKSKKQAGVIDYLTNEQGVAKEHLMHATGVSAAILASMEKSGLIQSELVRFDEGKRTAKEMQRLQDSAFNTDVTAQAETILADHRPTLLFHDNDERTAQLTTALIAQTLKAGKSVLFLSPEIVSAQKLYARMAEVFGAPAISLVHSGMTVGERRAVFRTLRREASSFVIGTRTALFAPVANLGLVIVSDEHEWTYKSEQTPRYHTRLTAEALTKIANAKLVLSSATPSLDSWRHATFVQPGAQAPRYDLVRTERSESTKSPVTTIDLAEATFGTAYPFTPKLLDAIELRLKKNEQSVLLLNRRGAASALLCLDCRNSILSPDTHLPLTLHEGGGRPFLVDHYTGRRQDVPATCPVCKSTRLHAVGAGTQKAETLLKKFFPNARILLADADTLESPDDIQPILKALKEHEADILVGTQTVVKALDLPGITLAGVLVADVGLSLPNFRAGERVFSLVSQLTSRMLAHGGEVIIQTFRPSAPEIQLAAERKAEQYLQNEIQLRAATGYPPFSQMIRLIVRGKDSHTRAKQLAMEATKKSEGLDCLVNMAPALGEKDEWYVFLRGTLPRKVLSQLALKDTVVDVDPVN